MTDKPAKSAKIYRYMPYNDEEVRSKLSYSHSIKWSRRTADRGHFRDPMVTLRNKVSQIPIQFRGVVIGEMKC